MTVAPQRSSNLKGALYKVKFFLFTIVAEGLSGLVRKGRSKRLYKGYLVGKDGVEVS